MNKLTKFYVKNSYKATFNHYRKLVYSLFITLMVLLLNSPALAKYSGGTGEPNNPYLIATAADMNQIGAEPNDWSSHFLLVNDINLAEYTGTQFNIIGNDSSAFAGVFDGDNHKICNFSYQVNNVNGIGIFGCIDGNNAEIKNTGLINPNINVEGDVGGIGSLVGVLCKGKLTHCYVIGGKIAGGKYSVGGLVGVCGAIKYNPFRTAEVVRCFANIDIESAISGEDIGGLAGGTLSVLIKNSVSTGDVSGGTAVGGLVGTCSGHNPELLNSYSTGNVTADYWRGGLVGVFLGSAKNCYSSGVISNGPYGGGFIGFLEIGSFDKCFWNSNINPDLNGIATTIDPNVIGKSTIDMRKESTFASAGWDFVDTWDIGENQTYPFLRQYPAGDLNHDGIVNFPDFAIFAGHWLADN